MADNEYLTSGEAAKRLGVHPKTLRQYVKDEKVDYHRLPSKRLRFRVEDIDKLREAR